MRGVGAYAQLDHVAQNWARRGGDGADLDRMLDVLTDSWWHLLSNGDS